MPDPRVADPAPIAERHVPLHDGRMCVCRGGTRDERPRGEFGPPIATVSCAYAGQPPRTLRLSARWDRWPIGRLAAVLAVADGAPPPPRSAEDAPPSVDRASVREDWDVERGYCREIRWDAGGRRVLAWIDGPSWSSSPDVPISAGPWHARFDEGNHRPEGGPDFDPPTHEWWAAAGVVARAMSLLPAPSE